MRAIHAIIVCTQMLTLTACGGSSPPPAAEPEAPAGEQPPASAQSPAETPAVVAVSDEPVSWRLMDPMSIDRDGVVRMGGSVMGTLSDGTLVGRDGATLASVGADGYVSVQGERTRTHISGLEVLDDDEGGAMFRIEGDELVTGGGEERMPIENLTPARATDVLLVSTFAIHAMARGFQH